MIFIETAGSCRRKDLRRVRDRPRDPFVHRVAVLAEPFGILRHRSFRALHRPKEDDQAIVFHRLANDSRCSAKVNDRLPHVDDTDTRANAVDKWKSSWMGRGFGMAKVGGGSDELGNADGFASRRTVEGVMRLESVVPVLSRRNRCQVLEMRAIHAAVSNHLPGEF